MYVLNNNNDIIYLKSCSESRAVCYLYNANSFRKWKHYCTRNKITQNNIFTEEKICQKYKDWRYLYYIDYPLTNVWTMWCRPIIYLYIFTVHMHMPSSVRMYKYLNFFLTKQEVTSLCYYLYDNQQ